MNNTYNYNGYSPFGFDTELSERKKKQRKTFSRLFFALFIYLLSFNVITIATYLVAALTLGEEAYEELLANPIADILISSGVQYLIAFPLFLILTFKVEKSERCEKKKLPLGELVILFAASEVMMFVGNIIGTVLNTFIGSIIGEIPQNSVESVVTTTPMWLIFAIMVVIGPIVEEIIFRKVLIDRFSVYGDLPAIMFSAIAFGLMHGNLYQFFYAALLGLMLGYVYTSTRNVKYCIVIHMLINFLGSVVALPAQKATEVFNEQLTAFYSGLPFSPEKLATNGVLSSLYTSFQYGLMIAGAFVLIYRFKKKEIKISNEREIYLSRQDLTNGGTLNVGAILFASLTGLFIGMSLF